MGLFKKTRQLAPNKVAEAGPSTPGSKNEGGGSGGGDSLDLFGNDSDASDDDATIDRYVKKESEDMDDSEKEAAESKKVSVLTSKLSPEELFKKYDTDGSGAISIPEFLAMLPDLGINISEAKAIRIFKKCDTDGGGEIDLNEFKMAMFTVDPVSGNTMGFSPSNLLSPKDAFDLFDEDGTGKIDDLEFADILEYFGMNVSDAKQEAIFKKYDKDKSGYIDYKEFRSMWLRFSNPREELEKRGIEVPKYTQRYKLQEMLEKVLEEEEAREALVMAEAERFLKRQRERDKRMELGRKAKVRAQDELSAALDAAGQVYILGSGKYNQFSGDAVPRDEILFPGFKDVSEIWSYRVCPNLTQLQQLREKAAAMASRRSERIATAQKNKRGAPELPSSNTTAPSTPLRPAIPNSRGSSRARKIQTPQTFRVIDRRGKYVRRRPENKRWKFQSPPKLNRLSIFTLKSYQNDIAAQTLGDSDLPGSREEHPENQPSSPVDTKGDSKLDLDNDEDTAKLFFEDRELVRSLRFRSTKLMTNTGGLWGRGVVQGSLSDNVAFVVTGGGSIFTWGGKTNTWQGITKRFAGIDDDNDDDNDAGDAQNPQQKEQEKDKEVPQTVGAEEATSVLTPRSQVQKMCTNGQLRNIARPELEVRAEEEAERQSRHLEEDTRYERMKKVIMYYDQWEPPPSNSTRLLFMEHVLVPRVDYATMILSAAYRGIILERITKMDLILLLGECFELEIEIRGEQGHNEFKETERLIKQYTEEKNVKLIQPEKDKLLQSWEEIRIAREKRQAGQEDRRRTKIIDTINRADDAFHAMLARRAVQMEDMTPEFTARGVNAQIDMSGITSRGPALHSPRGAVAVSSLSAGGSHVALVMHDGSVYTWGIGSAGRLGLEIDDYGRKCVDSNHPQRVNAFRDVAIRQLSCAYSHSAAVAADGKLYTWGSASSGKLGVGVVEDQYEQHTNVPLLVKFPGQRSIRFVSCGSAHTGAVSTAGELFMWGCANGGRLGLGDQVKDTIVAPTLVRDLQRKKVRVWQVSCGNSHSALCTEIMSENRGGNKNLLGGEVYVCGGTMPLGRFVTTWECVESLKNVAIRQVSCGVGHTAAVSAYGELYSWGRNQSGCTGHAISRKFIPEPMLVKSFHVEAYNLALGKPCRQMTVYNEQDASLAVNGDVEGVLAKCAHTHLEDKPWWEVDLGQPAVIERIRVWNRTDQPLNPSKSRTEYSDRLFPFWIFVSEDQFQDLEGREGLHAAKIQSNAFEQFHENKRMTEWILPTANIMGRYVRVQLQKRNFLHIAEVEVFGVYSAFKYVGKVGSVQCGNEATMVIMPPAAQETALGDYYLRAIEADADNATILRQYEAYEEAHKKYGRGNDRLFRKGCQLCRTFRQCEVCEFYAKSNVDSLRDANGTFPSRLVGDRMGLSELIDLVVSIAEAKADEEDRVRRADEEAQRQREKLEREVAEMAASGQKRKGQPNAMPANAPPASLAGPSQQPIPSTETLTAADASPKVEAAVASGTGTATTSSPAGATTTAGEAATSPTAATMTSTTPDTSNQRNGTTTSAVVATRAKPMRFLGRFLAWLRWGKK